MKIEGLKKDKKYITFLTAGGYSLLEYGQSKAILKVKTRYEIQNIVKELKEAGYNVEDYS